MNSLLQIRKLPLLPLALFKSSPTRLVSTYSRGQKRKGALGLSGLLVTTNTTLISVPIGTLACPFSLECNSSDRQKVSLSGTAIFSISSAEKLGSTFDFSVNELGQYQALDPSKVHDRLSEILASVILTAAVKRSLSVLLGPQDEIAQEIQKGLNANLALESMGIVISSFAITGIEPAPDIGKALEAIRSEELKKEADAATHERQLAAELKDRQLKQESLVTGKVVQEGERDILEAKYETSKRQAFLEKEVQRLELDKDNEKFQHTLAQQKEKLQHTLSQEKQTVESQVVVSQIKTRSELEQEKESAESEVVVSQIRSKSVQEKAKNLVVLGEAEGKALQARADAIGVLDAKKLQALALSGGNPGTILATAFLDLAEKANQIGSLNITPDLLQSLVDQKK